MNKEIKEILLSFAVVFLLIIILIGIIVKSWVIGGSGLVLLVLLLKLSHDNEN